MATIAETVVVFAPQFSGDSRIDSYVELATLSHDIECWGVLYVYAMAYWVAHKLTKADQEALAYASGSVAGTGTITSKGAGDLSIGYGALSSSTMSATDQEYLTTSYGISYLQMRTSRSCYGARLIEVDG